jgi:hypothetical protein
MSIGGLPFFAVDDAAIPDPYTPPDGTFNITGALTASGAVTGTPLITTSFLTLNDGDGTAVSATNTARIRYSVTNNRLERSLNGAAYGALGVIAIGDTITSATAGSVLFAGTSGVLQQDNASLFWDDTNNRLGILITTPNTSLEVRGLDPFTGTSVANQALTNATILMVTTTTDAADVGPILGFGGTRTGTGNIGMLAAIRGAKTNATDANTQGYLGFFTVAANGTMAEQIRIDDAGRLLVSPTIADRPTTARLYVEAQLTNEHGIMVMNGGPHSQIVIGVSPNVERMAIGVGSSATAEASRLDRAYIWHQASTVFVIVGSSSADSMTSATVTTINVAIDASARFGIGNTATLTADLQVLQPIRDATASAEAFRVTSAAHTGLPISTEVSDIIFALGQTKTHTTGAITTQRTFQIAAPTYAFTGPSTITSAITMEIDRAPTQGTNATFTNAIIMRLGTSGPTMASAAAMRYVGLEIPAHTLTVTGTTAVTTTPAAAAISIGAITITNTSAVTIDIASAIYVSAPPVQGGLVTLTTALSIWVNAGNVRFDESIIFGVDGTAAFLEARNGSTAAVSATNQGRIRYNESTNAWQMSANGGAYAAISSGTPTAIAATNVTLTAVANGGVDLTGSSGFIQMAEITAPAAPAANVVRLFVRDNGTTPNNTTQFCAIFSDSSIVVIAASNPA